MNDFLGTVAVIGVVLLLVAVGVAFSKVLDQLAENRPRAYRWLTGTCTVGIFVLIVTDAFFFSIGVWGIVFALFLMPPWAHAFWLRDGEDHFRSEQEIREEVKDGT